MLQIRGSSCGKKILLLSPCRLEILLGYSCQPALFDVPGTGIIKSTNVMRSGLFGHCDMTDRVALAFSALKTTDELPLGSQMSY